MNNARMGSRELSRYWAVISERLSSEKYGTSFVQCGRERDSDEVDSLEAIHRKDHDICNLHRSVNAIQIFLSHASDSKEISKTRMFVTHYTRKKT